MSGEEKTILDGKVKIKDIKQAMKNNTVSDLVDDIWAEYDLDEWEVKKLGDKMGELENDLKSKKEYLGVDDKELPDVEDVMEMTDEQKEDLKEKMQKKEEKAKKVVALMKHVWGKLNNKDKKNPSPEQWNNYCTQIIASMSEVSMWKNYHKQLYEAEIVKNKQYDVTNSEAKSRARSTRHYRKYKNAEDLLESMDRFQKIAKKRGSANY